MHPWLKKILHGCSGFYTGYLCKIGLISQTATEINAMRYSLFPIPALIFSQLFWADNSIAHWLIWLGIIAV